MSATIKIEKYVLTTVTLMISSKKMIIWQQMFVKQIVKITFLIISILIVGYWTSDRPKSHFMGDMDLWGAKLHCKKSVHDLFSQIKK